MKWPPFASLSFLLTACFLLPLLSGCGQSPDRYVIVSGGTTGVYYPTAGVIAELTMRDHSDVLLDVRSSGGSVANARLLAVDDAHFALMQNDIATYARAGTNMFEQDEPMPIIVGVAGLYPEHVQIVTLADSGIDSVLDLAGKRVAVGATGSGTEGNARQIFEAYDMSFDDLGAPERLTAGESASFLQDGRVDAAFFTFGIGTAAIVQLAEITPIKLLPVEGEARQNLMDEYGYYQAATIPAGAYQGVDQEVPTVSVIATLVARADVPDEVVRAVLEGVFNHLEDFRARHPRLKAVTRSKAREQLSIQPHRAAQNFYAEALEAANPADTDPDTAADGS